MEEFNTLEKVIKLFEEQNCICKENNYFVLMKDYRKYSGVVSGMEYPFLALLINQTEDGIGFFYIVQSKISLKVELNNSVVNKGSFTFLKNEFIESIEVKKFALLNKKCKSVIIKTKDRKKYYLYAKLDDDTLPYQKENFSKFIEKYSN